MKWSSIAIVIFALLSTSSSAHATEKIHLGSKIVASFECYIYAGMSQKKEEAKRLFELGLEAARSFVDALRHREFSDALIHKYVPLDVITRVQGPSTDFIVGRIFEGTSNRAFDKVTKGGGVGSQQKLVEDPSERKMVAEAEFGRANCALVK
jgi:hypothetical protein